jgi:hypothetical protein
MEIDKSGRDDEIFRIDNRVIGAGNFARCFDGANSPFFYQKVSQ